MNQPASRPVIQLTGVRKIYGKGEAEVRALDGVDLVVPEGDYVAIMGASGSGKSTLLNIIGCLDPATEGEYLLDGVDVAKQKPKQLAKVRNHKLGFVFQSFNLIPRFNALSNVELPMSYAGVRKAERRRRALAALDVVGLSERVGHLPTELSGGQQQRVAIARALVTEPALLLADEPTGNLDSKSTAEVLAILDRLNEQGRTVLMITHERDVAEHASRILHMVDGKIVHEEHKYGAAHAVGVAR
ncbi:putative ABC transport system ATP-binding protein [Crossiella equi]|uniref:ABC transport system ATP-binding protein n=1 Tax=Crossiella equi TaxID=130796 RepID=A0ABS5AHG9_9PSEU|nr:ABC transporter ATP-binding protein [Crossiella equi]MBP2476018.1 putative ABC transport system ATP-binding protein [Crossiella equi]